ncbi:MAG TPA: hypothetical protein VGI39_35825 [Polyangiaceae bacterium]
MMTKGIAKTLAVALLGCFALGLTEGRALAAEPKSGVITLREIEIVGRVQKPIASVDVGKIPPKLTLAELRQPFLDRIEEAVQHDPF